MSRNRKPIVLLIRQIRGGQPCWLLDSEHRTVEDAEQWWKQHISHRGITAWSWWGPRRIGEKMLADPLYDPDTDAVAQEADHE